MNTIKTFEEVSKIIYLLINVVGSIPREHTYWQKMYSLNTISRFG